MWVNPLNFFLFLENITENIKDTRGMKPHSNLSGFLNLPLLFSFMTFIKFIV